MLDLWAPHPRGAIITDHYQLQESEVPSLSREGASGMLKTSGAAYPLHHERSLVATRRDNRPVVSVLRSRLCVTSVLDSRFLLNVTSYRTITIGRFRLYPPAFITTVYRPAGSAVASMWIACVPP